MKYSVLYMTHMQEIGDRWLNVIYRTNRIKLKPSSSIEKVTQPILVECWSTCMLDGD